MRLRNIPRAGDVLAGCKEVAKNPAECRGRWSEVFGNPAPVHIEIGMGKGRFLLTLARQNPSVNYIGIERYSSVLLRAVEKLESENAGLPAPIPNIRFLCMDARNITEVFAPGEIDRIYLNFSDPWPKSKHASRRLTSRRFLDLYHQILAADGTVEFKTDNRTLFDYSAAEADSSPLFDIIGFSRDLHNDEVLNRGNVMTEYEEKFSALGNPIYKLMLRRNGI